MKNLQPVTEYTAVHVYYSTDSEVPSILLGSNTVSTTQNSADNYDRSTFAGSSGGFSVSGPSPTSYGALSEVMNEVFDTGDEIEFNLGAGTTKAKFVKRGGFTNVENGDLIAIPFLPSAGAGQTATLVLSDSSNAVVSYDETTEHLMINGQLYTSGPSLILDGQKVTLIDA